MNDHKQTPENFIQPLRHVTLSTIEAQKMRERLISYADMHNVVGVRTPHRANVFVTAFQSVHFSRSITVATLMFVFLVGSAGVSYAADSELPGDPLYAVKVNINEPLHTALITSPSDKAEWENELAGRRLAEASTLASQNKLASSTQVYIAQSVAEHVANSEKNAASLSASGNGAKALAVRSDLEARLSAHVDVLALMTPRLKAQGDGTTTSAVLALAQNVDAQRATVTILREQTETDLSNAAVATDENASVSNDTASTTPNKTSAHQDSVHAFVENQKNARQEKEYSLLNQAVVKFGITLPPHATTTATTTEKIVLPSLPTATSTTQIQLEAN